MESGTRDVALQVFVVGAPDSWTNGFMNSMGPGNETCVRLSWDDWSTTAWQMLRQPGLVWAIVHLGEVPPKVDDTCRWIQLLSVILRPGRLLVLGPELPLDLSIAFVRAGADGILPLDESNANIVKYLYNEDTNVQRLLPDPGDWLFVLRRVGEELLESSDLEQALARLLRFCCTRVQADRATLFLRNGTGPTVLLVAAVGQPEDLTIGSIITPAEDSITAWVLKNAKPLLTQGRNIATRSDPSAPIRSGISIPLLSRGECLGVVNVSRVYQKGDFSPADLSMIEVFAQMAGFAVANQRLHQAALDAERMAVIGRTTANISHCVKNILQSVKGGVAIAKMGLEGNDPENLASGLELASRGSDRLTTLVMELLEFSKTRQPEIVPADLSQIVTEVVDNCKSARPDSAIEVILDCEPLPSLLLDGDRLFRALVNLVGNAFDALNGIGFIFVRVRKNGQWIVFTVEDDGPGVPDDVLRDIFIPFFSTKGSKGTGLGLPMVRKFAEENKGTARAWNRKEGGLAVEITLPFVTAAEG